ncbi:MAG: hypothetical protein H7062_00260 [Candidatus Saccharimonas sp.]|nr:hypothetical protein [Planctomycetaceae bacterium]
MIPSFDERGYLPPGIHPATLPEIADRLGGPSELRRVQMDSLRWLVDLAQRVGVARLIVNGSFTTDAWEPNDIDCVLLAASDFPRDAAALTELENGLPFLDVQLVDRVAFDHMTERFFATDRDELPKGMLEVLL